MHQLPALSQNVSNFSLAIIVQVSSCKPFITDSGYSLYDCQDDTDVEKLPKITKSNSWKKAEIVEAFLDLEKAHSLLSPRQAVGQAILSSLLVP